METPKKRRFNKTEKARKYFDFLREENGKKLYKCKKCGNSVNGTQNSNLTSHLQHVHGEIYNDDICQSDDSVEFKRHELLLNCVELVSVNGRCFRSLNDSAILSMNKGVLEDLRSAGREINLKDKNLVEVKNLLSTVADKTKEKIKMEVKGLPVSLMIDICTTGDRSILGISIQFILNEKLVVRSIGMIELKSSHTAAYLSKVIIERLNEFDISCRQVITITTDNGANVVKTVKDIDGILQKVIDDAQCIPQTPNKKKKSSSENQISNDDAIDREIEAALAQSDDVTENEAYAILFDESDEPNEENQSLLTAIADELNEHEYGIKIDWKIARIQCDAHTLQLAVRDSKKATTSENENVIKLCQKVATYLRIPSTRHDLENANIKCIKPRLEVVTRWCSEYLMVSIFNH